MSDAIIGLIGVIVGAGIALVGTLITSKHVTKIELRKLSLSYLFEKRSLLQTFLNESEYEITGEMEEDQYPVTDEFKRIDKFIQSKRNYFLDNKTFENCRYELKIIENDKNSSPHEKLYSMRELNNKFNRLVDQELEKTERMIHKLSNLND